MVVRRKTTTRCCYCTARAHFDGILAFLACEEVKLHHLKCFACFVAVCSVAAWSFDHPECCCGGTAVPPALASSRVYQHRAETTPTQRNVTSVGRVSALRPLTLIDQLTNISNDSGSRSMIRSSREACRQLWDHTYRRRRIIGPRADRPHMLDGFTQRTTHAVAPGNVTR